MPPPLAGAAAPAGRDHVVHVVDRGWHTGLVIDRAALIPGGRLPEAAAFPDARRLEFGWGDRDFYMTPEETLWMTLKAALAPTPAVMHVAPVRAPADASADAVRLVLSEREHRRLVRAVSASFDRSGAGRAQPLGPGLGPGSRFYAAKGRFHILNTCNTWTARVLEAAGLSIAPQGVVTASTLMRRLREAKLRRPPASPPPAPAQPAGGAGGGGSATATAPADAGH
jgi:uncharacterized protein (TIGR02117 family)